MDGDINYTINPIKNKLLYTPLPLKKENLCRTLSLRLIISH